MDYLLQVNIYNYYFKLLTVFCVQTSALIPIGDVFLYGSTAALAWNLPSDPKHLLMLKNKNIEQKEEEVDEMAQNSIKRYNLYTTIIYYLYVSVYSKNI